MGSPVAPGRRAPSRDDTPAAADASAPAASAVAGAGGPLDPPPEDPWRWKYATTDAYLRLADNPVDTEVRVKQTLAVVPWLKVKPGLTLRLPPAVRPAAAAAASADRRHWGVGRDDRRGWWGQRGGDGRDGRDGRDGGNEGRSSSGGGGSGGWGWGWGGGGAPPPPPPPPSSHAEWAPPPPVPFPVGGLPAGAWAPPPAVDPRVDVKVGGRTVAGRLRLRPPVSGRPSTLQLRVVAPLPGTDQTVLADVRLVQTLPSHFAPPPPPPPPPPPLYGAGGAGSSSGPRGALPPPSRHWGLSPGGATYVAITLRGVDAAFVKLPAAVAGVRFPARLGDRTKVLLRARKPLATAAAEALGGGRRRDKDGGAWGGAGGSGVRLDLKYRLAVVGGRGGESGASPLATEGREGEGVASAIVQ